MPSDDHIRGPRVRPAHHLTASVSLRLPLARQLLRFFGLIGHHFRRRLVAVFNSRIAKVTLGAREVCGRQTRFAPESPTI